MYKETSKIIIFSIQESFISLFPYLIVRAMLTLIFLFNEKYTLFDLSHFDNILTLFYDLFPLLVIVSLSIQLSKNFQINNANFTIASTIAFILISGYFSVTSVGIEVYAAQSLIFSLLIPLITLFLIFLTKKMYYYYFDTSLRNDDNLLMQSFSYLYFYVPLLVLSLASISNFSNSISKVLFSAFTHFSIEVQAFLHLFISHLTWFFGIHGTTSYRYIFDMYFYTQEIYLNFPYETFFSTFVIFGGAGSTLSLILAILFISKNKRHTFVAKSALPFSIFNINEPLIYGLPLVLNKNFLLPFILLPLINFFLSLLVLKLHFISITNPSIPWTTPPLISGYLLTDSLFGLLWQIFLILLGVFIYMPFVKNENKFINTTLALHNKLSFSHKLNKENQNFKHHMTQVNLRSEIHSIATTLEDVLEGDLVLYYQPQIHIKNHTIYGYEALLRLKKDDQTYPPTFLSAIEKSGLEEIIDMWTIQQVAINNDIWLKSTNSVPKISINIYPKTLLNNENVDRIIEVLSDQNIQIELLEYGFKNNLPLLNLALDKLRAAGFIIALDDYGSHESNLSLLNAIPIDVIKLDRSMLQSANNTVGKSLFITNCKMLKTLNVTLIAEAVETKEELDLVHLSQVDVVQGWYYAPALPLSKAITYRIKPINKT